MEEAFGVGVLVFISGTVGCNAVLKDDNWTGRTNIVRVSATADWVLARRDRSIFKVFLKSSVSVISHYQLSFSDTEIPGLMLA